MIFSSHLSLASQEWLHNIHKKVSGFDIFNNFQSFVSKWLFTGFVEYGYHKVRQ